VIRFACDTFCCTTAFAAGADSAMLPARPDPITFTPAGFNDPTGAPMYVADVDGKPFFLEEQALIQVRDAWASGELSQYRSDQKLLLIAGPVKSGKTHLLRLLPRLLRPDSRRKPVVFQFTFPLGVPVAFAAHSLARTIAMTARELGMTVADPQWDGLGALTSLQTCVGQFAKGIAAAGGELILLLDEVQAPLLSAESPADADSFASMLKAIHDECYADARMAVTGSGMIALQHSLSSLPPNGYPLWASSKRVHLGATPTPAAARAMAEAIVRSRSAEWPQAARELVTADYVVGVLTAATPTPGQSAPPRLTTARPAMVGFFVDQMLNARVGSARAVAELALSSLRHKMSDEVLTDAAVALAMFDDDSRRLVYRLAAGKLKRAGLPNSFTPGRLERMHELLATVCQPGSDPVELLPPYSDLFKILVDVEGALIVEWVANQFVFVNPIRQQLKFFFEHQAELAQYKDRAPAMSAAVLRAMAGDGHGVCVPETDELRPVATLEEMEAQPVFQTISAILISQAQHKTNDPAAKSESMAHFQKHRVALTDPSQPAQKRAKATEYQALLGLNFLVWLRHIDAHVYIHLPELVKARITGSVLRRWLRAAIKVWQDMGGQVDAKTGVPIVPRPASDGSDSTT